MPLESQFECFTSPFHILKPGHCFSAFAYLLCACAIISAFAHLHHLLSGNVHDYLHLLYVRFLQGCSCFPGFSGKLFSVFRRKCTFLNYFSWPAHIFLRLGNYSSCVLRIEMFFLSAERVLSAHYNTHYTLSLFLCFYVSIGTSR